MKKIIFLLFPLFTLAQNPSIDFLTADADLQFDLSLRQIKGTVAYTFDAKSLSDTVSIDARQMNIHKVTLNNAPVEYIYKDHKIQFWKGYHQGKNTLKIQYDATPTKALYFLGTGADIRIWTQGQGKNNSHWIPSFDDPNEKVIFGLNIQFDKRYEVISNGVLKSSKIKDATKIWCYQMEHPMSSYLLMIAIGKFDKKKLQSQSGVTIENYSFPNESEKYEPTYRHTKKIFDYLESTIGIPYPWKIYRNIPVDDFMYGGMENTTSTIFSKSYFVDAIAANDIHYSSVNAHEMAHQWFGDLVTEKSPKDHWLQEGFATYYALLSKREIEGLDAFYWELYTKAQGIVLDAKQNKNTIVWSQGATTTSYYDKAAWCIYYLLTQIGEDKLHQVVKNYLTKYAYANASTEDFIEEIHLAVPEYSTENFKKWLQNPSFDIKTALQLIAGSPYVHSYIELVRWQDKPFEEKKEVLYQMLTEKERGYPARTEAIYQLKDANYNDAKKLYDYIQSQKDWRLNQAVASRMDTIPSDFLTYYETFLDDPSYITQELAMKNLWLNAPEKREKILNKMKHTTGMNDKNLRISWLLLALSTPNYKLEEKSQYYRELEHYASANFNANTRINAITALWFLNQNDSNLLPHLINGLTHHDYKFYTFCKEAITKLCEKEVYRDYFERQIPILPEREHQALKKILRKTEK